MIFTCNYAMNRCRLPAINPLLAFAALLCLTGGAQAIEFSAVQHAGTGFTVIKVDPGKDKLHLFPAECDDRRHLGFANLNARLADRGQKLRFAMNAGMFETNLAPVGLLVADGVKVAPINLSSGFGNFYLKPNGVFLVANGSAHIVSSPDYVQSDEVTLATQSGPLLLRDGVINTRFDPASSSKLIRNGVGITAKGEVVFAISEGKVNFHDFAALFRDELHCTDALYLDGSVSSLYAPELGRNDNKSRIGPIIGVLE